MLNVAVGYETDELHQKAQLLASQLNLSVDNEALIRLVVTLDKLVLQTDSFSPLSADFTYLKWQKRRQEGKKQGIVSACKPAAGMRIIDATAGWGRDAAILASFGAKVLMLERNPVMAVLLQDALNLRDDYSREHLNLSIKQADACDYLHRLAAHDYPDVIYLDPMHPERQKSALVKKDMQILQQLIGADVDVMDLLLIARKRTAKKVVVKWPQPLPPLMPPSASIMGKTVRFDIYLASY